MRRIERFLVFSFGLVLLAIFTFTDLQISKVLFTQNPAARVLEVVGEIPFLFLTLFACALLFWHRSKKTPAVNIVLAAVYGFLMAFFTFMGAFMTWNYLNENLGGKVPVFAAVLIGAALLAAALLFARSVPKENARKAVTYAIIALIFFVTVLIVMNVIKTCWGRMRMRAMTDPDIQFTPWYIITNRGGFDNNFASFPSGHSMNSAAVILLSLLPSFVPAFAGREKLMKIIAYVWILLVGSSRIVMGAHFASDVTVGIMLSLLLFEIIRTAVCKLRKETLLE